MEKPAVFAIKVTHDCGHQTFIDADKIDEPYICVGCGATDELLPDNKAYIRSKLGDTLLEAKRRLDQDGERGRAEWKVAANKFD